MRRLEREAIDLTQRCLQEFWQQDASFVISCLAEIAGEQDKKLLIPVHRSYLVNPDYISSIERYTLTLLNGTKIPIPVRKYNEVREVLLHFYEGAEA